MFWVQRTWDNSCFLSLIQYMVLRDPYAIGFQKLWTYEGAQGLVASTVVFGGSCSCKVTMQLVLFPSPMCVHVCEGGVYVWVLLILCLEEFLSALSSIQSSAALLRVWEKRTLNLFLYNFLFISCGCNFPQLSVTYFVNSVVHFLSGCSLMSRRIKLLLRRSWRLFSWI